MTPIQQFRCKSPGVPRSVAAIEAKFDTKSNKDVIRWEDIDQIFPGAMFVLKKNVLVGYECDGNMKELVPRRIAAYPDEILEVVVAEQGPRDYSQSHTNINDSVAAHQNSIRGSVDAPSVDDLTKQVNRLAIVEQVQQNQGSGVLEVVTGTSVSSTNTQYMINTFQHTANLGLRTIVENQRHQTDRVIDTMTRQRAELLAEVARGNEKQDRIIRLQEEMRDMQEEMRDMQEEMKDLQKQALDRLAIIQGRIQTILTQNYELLEYPIPRLFIILPREPRFRDRFNPFTVPFRLYFLCECGTHTMGESASNLHKIHIAKHEGYDIDQPTEFLEKYGPYILAILQMIKYGSITATAVVPALAIADISEQIKLASDCIKHFKENFRDLVDDAISILQSKIEPTDPTYRDEGQSEFNGIEALEGADLRQLESYLKNKDSARTLGNLYRVVTNEGHVKWVCLDHYRENYKEVTRKQLREVVESNGGDFNENEGKISIDLESRILARQFYDALQRTRGIYDLNIGLLWDATLDDLRQLGTTVRMCNISILKLGAQHFSGPASDVFNRGRRFDPLLDIMTNGRIRSFELEGCQDFFKKISRFPQGGNASTLQSLNLIHCDIRASRDIVSLFDGLPSVKHIKIQEFKVGITLSKTESPTKSTEGRVLDAHLLAKDLASNSLMRDFDEWSNMNIVHFEADLQTISAYGLRPILLKNQQLETLTVGTYSRLNSPAFAQEMTRTIQQLCHPLRELNLDFRPFFSWTASLRLDHGRIISGTLQEPQYGTIELNNRSVRRIKVNIEGGLLFWGFQGTQGMYNEGFGIFPALIDALPNLLVQEIACSFLDRKVSLLLLRELLAVSESSLATLSLASIGVDWVALLRGDDIRNGRFPNLTRFMYHRHSMLTMPFRKAMLAEACVERLINWLIGFLPLKSPQQTRQQKMSVELKNIDMGFGSWDRLLNSIDYQSIHEFKLIDCAFSEEMLSVLETALINADLNLCVDGMKHINPERKDAFIASFQHSNVRIKLQSDQHVDKIKE